MIHPSILHIATNLSFIWNMNKNCIGLNHPGGNIFFPNLHIITGISSPTSPSYHFLFLYHITIYRNSLTQLALPRYHCQGIHITLKAVVFLLLYGNHGSLTHEFSLPSHSHIVSLLQHNHQGISIFSSISSLLLCL
jgi:hypothetical protein